MAVGGVLTKKLPHTHTHVQAHTRPSVWSQPLFSPSERSETASYLPLVILQKQVCVVVVVFGAQAINRVHYFCLFSFQKELLEIH